MRKTSIASLFAALLFLQPAQTAAQIACPAVKDCPAKGETNTFSAYQIINPNPTHPTVSPRSNVGLQIIGPGTGPDNENNAVDAFAYNGFAQYVAERYDIVGGKFVAVGPGEIVGGYFGAAFVGSSDPVDAGMMFLTTEAQTATHNGMNLVLSYTPNGSTALTTGLAVSSHGAGGVTIGDEHVSGPISDLGNGTLHAAKSIATGEHFTSMGAAPGVSSCGARAAVSGTDAAGMVSTGASATSCAVTFAKAYASTPVCIAQTYANAAPVTFVSGLSPTGFTVGFSAPLSGAFSYICMGRS